MRNQREPAARDDLRQRGGVAERVGQPHLQRLDARTRSRKNRLPATNWRASASPPGMLVSDSTHIPPTGTNRPSATCCPDPLEQLRVVLPQPRVLLGRRGGEHELRRRRPSDRSTLENVRAHLADGLAHRPQPGRVDVRVPDGVHPVGARHARARPGRRRARRGPLRRCRRRRRGRRRRPPAPARAGSRPAAAGPLAARRPARTASRCPASAPRPARRAAPMSSGAERGRAGRRPRSRGRPARVGAERPVGRRRPGWTPPPRRGRPRIPARRSAARARCAARCRRRRRRRACRRAPRPGIRAGRRANPRSTTSSGRVPGVGPAGRHRAR